MAIALIAAGLLARGGLVWPRPDATLPSTSPAVAFSRPARADVASPGPLYLVHDWRLGSQNSSDWRQAYPGWQETGGWIEATWEELNPAPAVYDFSRLIEYVETSPHDRPTAISLVLHSRNEHGPLRLMDRTPAWVYDEIEGHTVVDGRPVGYLLQPEGCDRPASMPMYDNAVWQTHLDRLIAALADEFDNPDTHAGLQAIAIGRGFEDLDAPTHDLVCAYTSQLTPEFRESYAAWNNELVSHIAARFSHRRIWLTATPARAVERASQIILAGGSNLGLMIVQPTTGATDAHVSGLSSIMDRVPLAWRLAEPDSLAQTYRGILEAVGQGAGWIDIQWAHLLTVQTINEGSGFDLLAFAGAGSDGAGEGSRRAWVVFTPGFGTPTEGAPNTFTSGLAPDFTLQDQILGIGSDEDAAPRFGSLPLQITAGWGTDARRGVSQIAFTLYDSWPAGEPATLRIIYLDRGYDTFDLFYPVSERENARRTVTKGNTNEWILAEFPVREPAWDMASTHDLIVTGNEDGDELLHFVELHSVAPASVSLTTCEAAGWERVIPGSPVASQSASTVMEVNKPAATSPPQTGIMRPVYDIPLLVWLLVVVTAGILILGARLLTFKGR